MAQHFSTTARRQFLIACLTAAATVLGARAVADTMPSQGELAAAIRSADLPCAHVLGVEPAGDNQWVVACNSGRFVVTRGPDGKLSVSQSD